jgi:hypothetical protein
VQWRLQHPAEALLVTGLKRATDLPHHVQTDAVDEVLVRLYRIMSRQADPLEMIDQEAIVAELVRQREIDPVARARSSPRATARAARSASGSTSLRAGARWSRWRTVVLEGAGDLCAQFGGDGRAVVAGIDRLPQTELDSFIAAFYAAPWAPEQTA